MTAQAIIQAIGDAPERAYAAGENAVRHVVTEWATRALLAEERLDRSDAALAVAARDAAALRARLADVMAELDDFRAVARGRM